MISLVGFSSAPLWSVAEAEVKQKKNEAEEAKQKKSRKRSLGVGTTLKVLAIMHTQKTATFIQSCLLEELDYDQEAAISTPKQISAPQTQAVIALANKNLW